MTAASEKDDEIELTENVLHVRSTGEKGKHFIQDYLFMKT